jgi:tetratricopeptide (TPR) repeat protein
MRDDRRTDPPFRLKQAETVRLYAGIFLGVVGLLAIAYFVGRPAIHKWRYNKDMANAERYEREGDFRSAMLTLEQVNRLHPGDAEARRRLAGFYERGGQLESVEIWREAVALEPTNAQGHLGLARAAVRFGDRQTAREALAKLEGSAVRPADYYRLRAGLAVLERDPAGQEENLTQWAILEPENDRVRLNLAMIRIADPHGAKAPAARAALIELARKDEARMRAIAELLGDVARRWPVPTPERDEALRELAGTLTPARGPVLALPSQMDYIDRLVRFAMEQPSPEAEDVVSLANWMSLNGQTETALQWIDTLPAPLNDNGLLKTAHAEFAVRAKDWDRLRRLLLAGAWGKVPTEAVEQAFRAHGQPAPAISAGMRAGWSAALDAGKASPAGLRMLLRLAELWAWPAEHRQVLLTIARTMPRETWAWRQLISLSLGRADTEQLWQVYNEWRLAVPGDPIVRVESAIMGFLLGRRQVPSLAEAAEYAQQQPLNPGAAVAHALALWRAGRIPEAAAVIDGLSPEAWSEPRYALAGGVLLAEAGRATESQAMLNRLAGEFLLPEERALAAAARERNRRTP